MTDPVSAAASRAFAGICAEAARASADYHLLEPGDRVLAALSGGLDSFVLLETLLYLQKRVPFEFSLQAVTFDPQFDTMQVGLIAEYCRLRNVEHHMIGMDIGALLTGEAGERFRRPCVRCSRLRRGKLYGMARELGCNKLALGHHADDLLESFFISLVRGQGLTTMGLNVHADTANAACGELRIIRPLGLSAEKTVKAAAGKFEFPVVGDCPYQTELDAAGDRAWAKRQLAQWQERIPDLRQLMLKSLGKVELDWLLDKRYLSEQKNH